MATSVTSSNILGEPGAPNGQKPALKPRSLLTGVAPASLTRRPQPQPKPRCTAPNTSSSCSMRALCWDRSSASRC